MSPDMQRALEQLQKVEDEARIDAAAARLDGNELTAAAFDVRAAALATARDILQGRPF